MKTRFALLPAYLAPYGLILFSLVLGAALVAHKQVEAQRFPFIIWVYDADVRDSQFGYYDGSRSQAVGQIYADLDVEGLSCLNATIYATSGGDGRVPSRLFTLGLDVGQNTARLKEVAPLSTADGDPLYEVSSLATGNDQLLWAFAAEGDITGLIQIDPTSAVATLMEPSNLDVAAVGWLDDTLWLAAGNQLYTWRSGTAITPAFRVPGMAEIEALDVIDGLIYLAADDTKSVVVIDPANQLRVGNASFTIPDDIEGFTFCPDFQPPVTPTATATPTVSPTVAESPTSTPTATPSPTPSALPTDTPTALPTATASATAIATLSPTATPSPSFTPTATEVGGVGETVTPTPTPTFTPTALTPPAATVTTLPPPTALEVMSFHSIITASGLDLFWETAVEVDTVGFRLWRSSTGQRDQAVPLGPNLIAAQGNPSTGATYHWLDETIVAGSSYTYWLEAVRAEGTVNETLSVAVRFARPLYMPYLQR